MLWPRGITDFRDVALAFNISTRRRRGIIVRMVLGYNSADADLGRVGIDTGLDSIRIVSMLAALKNS